MRASYLGHTSRVTQLLNNGADVNYHGIVSFDAYTILKNCETQLLI